MLGTGSGPFKKVGVSARSDLNREARFFAAGVLDSVGAVRSTMSLTGVEMGRLEIGAGVAGGGFGGGETSRFSENLTDFLVIVVGGGERPVALAS